ncbi:DUF6127 family protein [Paremcibacter congregatus]|uniref:Uncharacterized protein n=1 Tax=Paremcibacter congregatus TaxID=2043170 RepID=A0A2G4YRE8_9PROT|nr:DUF6127 family protein [Paremcibacter congregatus]PHZ84901.1 hypothetical protein CRD36_09245 [Paremcibacter congregatus]QDE26125.1 hypothetical protein FIV45_01900 [Paremcibacter congregatus]
MRIGAGLTQAVRQAERQGIAPELIYDLIEQASEEGARRALAQLGLSDGQAGTDITELRLLLDSWRDVRRTALQALVRWLMRLCFSALILGLAVKFKLLQLGQIFGQ